MNRGWIIFTGRRGEQLPLFTDTEVNNCLSTVYTTKVNSQPQKVTVLSANGQNSREAKGEAILACSEVNST